jgi:hypothetical protein
VSRSVTLPIPTAGRLVRVLVGVLIVAAMVGVGVRVGLWIVSPGPAAEFAAGGLQQVQTAGGTYVGRIVADDGTYVRIAAPAIVRPESAESGRLLVQLLTADPFDLGGDILVPRTQVLLIGNVTAGSGLETAYRQAIGELPPAPTPTPKSSP